MGVEEKSRSRYSEAARIQDDTQERGAGSAV